MHMWYSKLEVVPAPVSTVIDLCASYQIKTIICAPQELESARQS